MGTKEIKEADVKSFARKMFKDRGYYHFPVNQGMFSRAGIPDDCLCVGGWFVAVEFKSELRWGNKATLPRPTQVLEMNKIWAAGSRFCRRPLQACRPDRRAERPVAVQVVASGVP